MAEKPLSDHLTYEDAERILQEASVLVSLSEKGETVVIPRQSLLELIAFAYEQGRKDEKEE